MPKQALGRGLGAIFGEEAKNAPAEKSKKAAEKKENVSRETSKIKISLIEPNKDQPRKIFKEESLKELAESIKKFGVLQPLLVKKNGNMYEIIVGERRWRAAKLAGLREIPAIVKDLEKKEAAEIALIENIQREDLGPVEEAKAYRDLIDEYHMTQEELAERVSKNRTTITNSMRLLQLGDDVLSMLEEGTLSAGHARTLLSIKDKSRQLEAAKKMLQDGMSVREAENYVKALENKTEKKKAAKKKEKDIYLEDLAKKLTSRIGTKVTIKSSGKQKGRIEIDYYSNEDLERISEKLGD